mmetsp:Transcript_33463/g.78221  ORF Transcript_33463/g.78221 Transcript_33463/m.78221 type:complete len:250 (-) Transcript_33463:144-893(-)
MHSRQTAICQLAPWRRSCGRNILCCRWWGRCISRTTSQHLPNAIEDATTTASCDAWQRLLLLTTRSRTVLSEEVIMASPWPQPNPELMGWRNVRRHLERLWIGNVEGVVRQARLQFQVIVAWVAVHLEVAKVAHDNRVIKRCIRADAVNIDLHTFCRSKRVAIASKNEGLPLHVELAQHISSLAPLAIADIYHPEIVHVVLRLVGLHKPSGHDVHRRSESVSSREARQLSQASTHLVPAFQGGERLAIS